MEITCTPQELIELAKRLCDQQNHPVELYIKSPDAKGSGGTCGEMPITLC